MIKTTSLFILYFCISILSYAQQNTISVKKKTTTDIQFDGLYYSKPMVQEFERNGKISHREARFYIILSDRSKVAVFNSSLSPKRVLKKMRKNRYKMIEESGNYSKSKNNLYFTVKSTQGNYSKLYRYVAVMIKNNMYLDYKAAYKQKIVLDIYLQKYDFEKEFLMKKKKVN